MRKLVLIGGILVLSFIKVFSGEFYSIELAQKYTRIALKDKSIVLDEVICESFETSKIEALKIFRFSQSETFSDGFIVFTQAKGRYDFFDYLIATSFEPEILKIKVLKYRSEKGGEISSKRWLKQFEGFSSGELRYKNEVSALSGATISAKSLTDDVAEVMKILHQVNKQ